MDDPEARRIQQEKIDAGKRKLERYLEFFSHEYFAGAYSLSLLADLERKTRDQILHRKTIIQTAASAMMQVHQHRFHKTEDHSHRSAWIVLARWI